MFPFFTVFFGIMFADMGYGLLLLAIWALGTFKLKPKGALSYMVGLCGICGVTTFLFGALTGGFFGDAIPVVAGMFGGQVTMPALFSPLEDPMLVLIGALVLGVVHILTGMAIKGYMLIRDGHWKDAVMDIGSWWLLFLGIALGALGITWWVCIAGVAALILTQGRDKPTLIGKLVGGIASLYDITSYLGDILSYSRLMALMLAGGVIASIMNTLGAFTGNILLFIPIFLVGHALNIGLNVLGCYVHTSRLMYLEYFGKFYKDGGRPFRPLQFETKYVDIQEEP
jgi:V/A-type H+-transporting ATPase subunit I